LSALKKKREFTPNGTSSLEGENVESAGSRYVAGKVYNKGNQSIIRVEIAEMAIAMNDFENSFVWKSIIN